MLHIACSLLAALAPQARVEIVPQEFSGGILTCSADGTWMTGVGMESPYFSLRSGSLRWSSATGVERLAGVVWGGVAIADGGDVVASLAPNASGHLVAALWTPAGVQLLPDLGPSNALVNSWPTALSRDGRFVSGIADQYTTGFYRQRAVRWTQDGSLLALDVPVGASSIANDLSDDGRTIVGRIWDLGSSYPPTDQLFHASALWIDGVLELLDDNGQAHGTSSDGTFVVGTSSELAYRWDRVGGMKMLEAPPPRPSPVGSPVLIGLAVSDDGATVLCRENWTNGKNTLASRSYLWFEGIGSLTIAEFATAVGADELLAFEDLFAHSMSADGRVVTGLAYDAESTPRFAMWRVTLPAALSR